MQDEDVLWLRESLARIRGEPAPSDRSTVYDAQLAAHVRDYQRQRRLTVDGIVGARTQIALTTDLGTPEAPLLIKSH
jgi:general secretion pathway protein A